MNVVELFTNIVKWWSYHSSSLDLTSKTGSIILQRSDGKEDMELLQVRFRVRKASEIRGRIQDCLLYTSPSPRDRTRSRMPSSA